MTEMLNVSGEEMVDVNMEDMSSINLDDLMADVVEVQAILQCNSVGQMIDVNEIYEKLEELAHIDRGQRIEYVATQLLHKMGVIDDPEVSTEERVFRFPQQGSEDSLAADSSSSDERSPMSEVSGSGGTQTENSVPFSNEIVTGCSRRDDVTVKCVSVPSAAILAHVNNENQNSEDCDIKIHQDSFHKSDADDKTLMNEAELIHSIIPHHDINQICACLEAYKDNDTRVHIVIETFLNLDSENAVPQLHCTEIPLVSCNVESTMTSPTSDNGTPSCDENHDHDKYSQHNRSLETPPAKVMEDMSSINLDDLMADVVEVQAILQCNSIGQMIDVNEIYEKLEELAFIDRGQRIEYVATQLLHKMGVIDDPEVSPEERVFRFPQQGGEGSLAADSSSSDERSPMSEVSGSGGTQTENSVPFSNEIVTGCSRKDDVTVKCVSVPSAAILALVNNENQNSEDCDIEIHQDSFHKSDADDKTLMNEAELIHSIIPHHDINQICAFLEAYKDNDTRVHIVIETFLKIDSESSGPQLQCTEIPLVSCDVESTMTSPTSDNGTPSCDENHDHDKYSQHNRSLEAPPANVIFLQETLADADLKCGNFHNSELTDEQTCQEMNRNVRSGLIQTCNSVHGVTEQTYKLEKEVRHKDRRVHEGNIEVMPSDLEQKEVVDVTSSSVKQNVSEGSSENIRCSSYRDLMCQTDRGSGDAIRDLTTSKPDENDMKLYVSCNGVPSLQDESSTYNIEGNFDPNMSCETNASPPSCSVSQIEESQAVPATSTSPSSPQDVGIVESNTVQETHVEVNGIGGEIGCIMTEWDMVLPIYSADETGRIFENKSQSDTLVQVQPECDVTVTAVAEEQCNPLSEQSSTVVEEEHYESCDSTASDDLVNLMDVVYEEGVHDRIVAKLHELFPDVRMDYLMRISQEYDSLTDMANKVLECCEQQNDHVDDTITMAVPSASALVPDSSASALAADPQSQGCRKKEITYEQFQSSLSHFAPELLMMVWEQIGNNYSKVKEFIAQHNKETLTNDQYHLLLGLFPHADAAFLRRKCNMIGNNEAALKAFIEEQLQTKSESQYHTLQAILPQLDSDFLRKKCDEFGDDEAAMRAFVVEHLQQNDVDDWYHSLLAMFPDTDPVVLRDIMNRIGDDAEAMRLFITQQLDDMEGVKFQTLLAVLPDADPDYLRDTFQSIGNDENSVKEFLLKALEKKDYPTRDAYLKRQEMAALQRKYKEELSIEDFIEMFPEPWKHFNEGDNNKGNELITRHGVAYLEARYKRIALDDIRSSFQKNKHNLTLTCSELDKWNGPVYPPRETYDCAVPKTEDIPVSFLQEVAFIENEDRIKDFIDTQEQWKREAFEMAKANGELLECQCCFDNEVMAEDMAACNEGHLFCKECIRRSAEIAIGNAQNGFACLTTCTAEFSLKVLRVT